MTTGLPTLTRDAAYVLGHLRARDVNAMSRRDLITELPRPRFPRVDVLARALDELVAAGHLECLPALDRAGRRGRPPSPTYVLTDTGRTLDLEPAAVVAPEPDPEPEPEPDEQAPVAAPPTAPSDPYEGLDGRARLVAEHLRHSGTRRIGLLSLYREVACDDLPDVVDVAVAIDDLARHRLVRVETGRRGPTITVRLGGTP